jgi:hypothetical protein
MSARTKAGRARLEADIAEVQRLRALGLTPMQVLQEFRRRMDETSLLSQETSPEVD